MNLKAVSFVSAAAGLVSAAAGQPFPVTGIGNLSGGPSVAWGISSGPGQPVVGETDTNNSLTYRACTFTSSMLATNNGSGPGGFFTPKTAYRISTTNLIYCGAGASASNNTRAFRNYGGVTTELGTINPVLVNSEARGVNNNGTIVGSCYAFNSYPGAGGSNSFAFKWVPTNPGTPISTAGTMSFVPLHAAYDVNDNDLAVGSIGSLPYQCNINTSALVNMGSLGGTLGSGAATSNNNAGIAVGWSPAPNNFRHAFRWTPAGGMTDIHPSVLSTSTTGESFAWDINNAGVIVGYFHGTNTGPNGHAFIYNPATGVWKDLNTWLVPSSGWVLETAYGISDGTCVVGRGKHNGVTEGYKICVIPPMIAPPPCGGGLTPIPDAATCPGGTSVFPVDLTPTGGQGTTVQWQWRRDINSEWFDVIDGVNEDPSTGATAFSAAIGGTMGASLSMTDIPSPDALSSARMVRAWLRGPCDTIITNAARQRVAPADVGRQGGLTGSDGLYDNNDFVAFIDLFFNPPVPTPSGSDNPADLGVQGGTLGSDGVLDNNDFVVFINLFFAACP